VTGLLEYAPCILFLGLLAMSVALAANLARLRR
jgi:hypothetical protein